MTAPTRDVCYHLNRLAGTLVSDRPQLSEQGAANVWAAIPGRNVGIQEALNRKAGRTNPSTFLSMRAVCNQLGGTTNQDEAYALSVASGTVSAAMTPWNTALGNHATAAAKMLVVGDSVAEGQGASVRNSRWVSLLRQRLRGDRASPYGGENYVPAFYVVGAPDSPWNSYTSRSGTPTESFSNGSLGYRTVFLDGADTCTYSVTGTAADIWWTGGTGVMNYQIDGGSVQTINTTGTYHTDYRTRVTLGASGPHTVVIGVASGTVGFSGFTLFDGDPTRGIQLYDAARSGSKSADHLVEGGELIRAIQTIAPQLVIVVLGGNDALQSIPPATFQSNLQTIVSGILGSVAPTPSLLVVGEYTPQSSLIPGGSAAWANYKAAMAAVVAGDPTHVSYLDLAQYMPTTDLSGTGYYRPDGLHPNDSGQARIADLVLSSISS
jgi:lysophospholipase L1-like esterase